MGTLVLWSKTFYTNTGQYPTLYDCLTITREDLTHWEYHLDNPNTSVNPKNFRSTLILPLVYSGEVSHHMHDSLETYNSLVCHETYNSLVCHTTHKPCPTICQSQQLSFCRTTNMTCPSICQSRQLSDHHTNDA